MPIFPGLEIVKISLIYENSRMEIRHFGWNWSLSDLWNALFGAYSVVGEKRINNSITKIKINLPNGSKQAKWATVINANKEYRDYCTTYGITKPSGKLLANISHLDVRFLFKNCHTVEIDLKYQIKPFFE